MSHLCHKANATMASCEICGKQFTSPARLLRHKGNKKPCKASTPPKEPTPPKEQSEFREASYRFNASLSKEERKEQGIYFTPKKARDALFSKLEELGVNPSRILEPSFGSGEFLLDAQRLYPEATLLGVEKNEELFKSVEPSPTTLLECCDFLDWSGSADLIIGNPPYFVLAKGSKGHRPDVITGRPNIYILFLYKCLKEHLEDDGFLAFIIPTSIYNCSYYQSVRDYINENTTIHHVESLNKPGFFETGQETTLLVLQKRPSTDNNFIFKSKAGNVYITPFYKQLYELTEGTQTLAELGLGVKTGNVVWNQHKDKLSDEPGTLLIYSSNINNSVLEIDNLLGDKRKQYVVGLKKPTLTGPLILVERGYGNSFSFNSVLVELEEFYAENHINVIYPIGSEATCHLERVLKSFQDERSKQFVRMFVGNGSISATELETLMPIW